MAIAFVQASAGTSQAAATSRTQSLAVTIGNLVVIYVSIYSANEGDYTVTSDSGDTPLLAVSQGDGSLLAAIWYYYATAGGTHTVTVDPTIGNRDTAMVIAEYSGADSGVSPSTNSATNTGTALTTGSVTSSVNGCLYIADFAYEGSATTQTADGGFTKLYSYEGDVHMPIFCMYQIQGTAGALNPGETLGASRKWNACVAVFSPTGGAPATTRGAPFGSRGTAFNGGRTFMGILR